jgi:NADPH2:quinone reductase
MQTLYPSRTKTTGRVTAGEETLYGWIGLRMKAVVLRTFGGPEQLVLEDVPDPVAAPGEIVIRTAAVSVNRSFDLTVRRGAYARGANLPLVLGADPVGTVTAVAPDVTFLKVNDRVAVMSTIACGACAQCRGGDRASCGRSRTIGVHRWGGYAEYVAVPAVCAAVVPDALDFPQACVIARHGGAAFNFLIGRGRLKAGETALILGAAGALGSFAVQIAKLAGATVIAAAGSEARARLSRELGADLSINYHSDNLVEAVMDFTDGRGVDFAFESSGDPVLWPQAFECLGQCGRIVTSGAHAGGEVKLDLKRLYIGRRQIIGAAGVDVADLDAALAAGAAGKLRGVIDRVMPLAKAADAHRLVENENPTGKVLLDPTVTK